MVYLFVPVALVFGLVFLAQGSPMTLKSSYQVATLEPGAMGSTDKGEAKKQTIVVGPVAAFEAIKMLGTNGGGFFGMNSAHPFENPTGVSDFFNALAMMLFPFALVLTYGRMLGRMRHGLVIFSVMLVLMVHPLLILMPTGLFAATSWGLKAVSNPGAHGLSQMLYQFSSASANNGSAFDGLGVTLGFANNVTAAGLAAIPWDIATGLVMLFGRFLPIIAPMAMAAYLGAKKASPEGLGTLHDHTPTFGILLIGTILIVGALLFLQVAVLGPVAEHLGPFPFGG